MALHNRQLKLNNVNSIAAKEVEAILRGPLTRRQKTLAKKRDANEERSFLLQLNEDLLSNVLKFLPGKDLAVLETVCTHFRYGSWVAVNKGAMTENTAKRKLEKMELGDMPPGFRCVCFRGNLYLSRGNSRGKHRRQKRVPLQKHINKKVFIANPSYSERTSPVGFASGGSSGFAREHSERTSVAEMPPATASVSGRMHATRVSPGASGFRFSGFPEKNKKAWWSFSRAHNPSPTPFFRSTTTGR